MHTVVCVFYIVFWLTNIRFIVAQIEFNNIADLRHFLVHNKTLQEGEFYANYVCIIGVCLEHFSTTCFFFIQLLCQTILNLGKNIALTIHSDCDSKSTIAT